MIVLKTSNDLVRMRKAGRVVAQALELVGSITRPGIRTNELDRAVEEFFKRAGAVPAFKGYHGFPASICASVNEVVVHGIPGDQILVEGDIIAVDIGAVVEGFYGDAAMTFAVGTISAETQRLLDVTRESLYKGIEQATTTNRLSDISHAVQTYVEAAGYSVVRDFVGHGVGRAMHEAPQVPNYGPPGRGHRLKEGMTLAIEPMVNMGGPDVEVLEDDWTTVTCDGSLSAHFEHSVAITENGPEILTIC